MNGKSKVTQRARNFVSPFPKRRPERIPHVCNQYTAPVVESLFFFRGKLPANPSHMSSNKDVNRQMPKSK